MALKRLANDRDLDLRPVRVWLEDLEELCEILGEDDAEVLIEADGMRADRIEELSQLPKARVGTLRLSRRGKLGLPEVTVQVTRNHQTVSTWGDDHQTQGRAHRVAAALRRRPRPVTGTLPSSVVTCLQATLFLTGVTAAGLSLVVTFGDGPPYRAWSWSGVALVLVAAFLWLLNLDRSVVISRRRAENPGFLRRNKDQLVVEAIAALLGGIFGGVVGFILGRVT